MDAANMIKEEGLKKGFMLATLISTIAGTFITGINLYDRVVDQRRQHKMDRTQNKKITELEARLSQAEAEKQRIKEAKDKGKRPKKRRDRDDNDDDDDSSSDDDRPLRRSLEHGGPSIQREFDRYLRNMGSRFAQGDLVAQTQLQSQIIILQSSVIKILEEALITGQPPDISRLYNTSEFAREGSIRALQDQYQRMIQQSSYPQNALAYRDGPLPSRPGRNRPGAPIRRISSTPSLRGGSEHQPSEANFSYSRQKALPPPSARGPPSTTSFSSLPPKSGPLFCQYAENLQQTNQPLKSTCPSCHIILNDPAEPSSWRVSKKLSPRDRSTSRSRASTVNEEFDQAITRSFVLTPRFMAKCHREAGIGAGEGYACYLCVCNRDRDTLCKSEEGLVNHVASKHGVDEYLGERDIREVFEGESSPRRDGGRRRSLGWR
ncbi:hypothetical protein QBC43DRAFT_325272 [Cladorrhinum sp. PSN259]|nr:hypothetical protein QBC43DRAFT_325272 [Cladorrhinum sp. PSN259]